MKTHVEIDGERFLINGRPTYENCDEAIHGMLFNSRMVQAIFDDKCEETRSRWAYPDTGEWDPERNVAEFCKAMPEYRAHGVLGVTVGLQGGGAIYSPEVYDKYVNSAFTPDGEFRQPYFDRLERVLRTADDLGMVVIVNYFYWKQVEKIPDDDVILDLTARTTEWLLKSGYRNVLVDIANESAPFWKRPLCEPENVHKLIEVAKATRLDGRRLPISVSTAGGTNLPIGRWREMEDFHLPHGNGCKPEKLKAKLLELKDSPEHKSHPRPIVVNEDSINMANFEAALECGVSWGFYAQGFGSGYGGWGKRERETSYEELSGFQTLPVNWTINTPAKKAFFGRVKELTGGGA